MDEITGHWNANFLSFSCHNRLPFGIWYFSGRCTECTHTYRHLTVFALRATNTIRFPKRTHALATLHGKYAIKWMVLELASVNTEHHQFVFPLAPISLASSLSHCQVNKPFFLRSNVLVYHIFTIHHVLGDVVCTCIFRTHPFLLLNPMTPEYHSIFRHPAAPLTVFFSKHPSISKTFISLATLSFDWLGECSFVEFRGFLSIPKCR